MSTPISAARAREGARQDNGQFGTQARAEAAVVELADRSDAPLDVDVVVEALSSRYSVVDGPVNPYMKGSDRTPRPSSMDEIRGECEDADLPEMYAVYEKLAERGHLSDFTAKNLTADEVQGDYYDFVETGA